MSTHGCSQRPLLQVFLILLLQLPMFAYGQSRLTKLQAEFDEQFSLGQLIKAQRTTNYIERQCDRLGPNDPLALQYLESKCWFALSANNVTEVQSIVKKLSAHWEKQKLKDKSQFASHFRALELFRAWLNWADGKSEKAEAEFRRLLEQCQSTFGRKHIRTSVFWRLLGQIAEQRGQFTKAATYYRNATTLTMKTHYSLAYDYEVKVLLDSCSWQRLDKLLARFKSDYELAKARLKDLPETAAAEQRNKLKAAAFQDELRWTYWSLLRKLRQGQAVKAKSLIPLCARLQVQEKKPTTNLILCWCLLANIKMRVGAVGAARIEVNRISKELSGVIGRSHPFASAFRILQLRLANISGQWLKANTLVVTTERRFSQFKHPWLMIELARSYVVIAHANWAQADFQRMGKRLNIATSLFRSATAKSSWNDIWRVRYEFELAKLMRMRRDYASVQLVLQRLDSVLKTAELHSEILGIQFLREKFIVAEELKRVSMGQSLFRRLSKGRLKALPENHPEKLAIEIEAVFAWSDGSRADKANKLLKTLLPKLKAHYGEKHWKVGAAEIAQGRCLLQDKKYDSAKYFLKSGLKKLGKGLERSHPLYLQGLVAYATAIDQLKQRPKAVKLLESALKNADRKHRKDPQFVLPLLEKLLWFYRRTNEAEGAKTMRQRLAEWQKIKDQRAAAEAKRKEAKDGAEKAPDHSTRES